MREELILWLTASGIVFNAYAETVGPVRYLHGQSWVMIFRGGEVSFRRSFEEGFFIASADEALSLILQAESCAKK